MVTSDPFIIPFFLSHPTLPILQQESIPGPQYNYSTDSFKHKQPVPGQMLVLVGCDGFWG